MTTKLLETLTLANHIDDWGRRLDVRYPDAVIITGDQMRQAMQEEIDELRQALAAIREACADVAFDKAPSDESACEISAAIRARSKNETKSII